jgi:nitroreductase
MTLADSLSAPLRTLYEARYSCRAYRDELVPIETVREILEIALQTPSWCNTQPWHATITSGEETDKFREHLSAAAQNSLGIPDISPPERYEDVYRDRRRASGFALYDSLSIAYDDKDGRNLQMSKNFQFFGAPHVAIITSEAKLGPYGYVDTGAFVTSFLLAATSLGVGSIAQAAIAMHSDSVRDFLGIPESRRIVCAISFGYADEENPVNKFRTDRATVAEAADFRGF